MNLQWIAVIYECQCQLPGCPGHQKWLGPKPVNQHTSKVLRALEHQFSTGVPVAQRDTWQTYDTKFPPSNAALMALET